VSESDELSEFITNLKLSGFDITTPDGRKELMENHRFLTSQRRRCEKFGTYAVFVVMAGVIGFIGTKAWEIAEAGWKSLK
jgi:hypothetical protein|tara:strand:- start:101 stop:340 length:240 start_codon:yes stop_codon:yes gene_type:complete